MLSAWRMTRWVGLAVLLAVLFGGWGAVAQAPSPTPETSAEIWPDKGMDVDVALVLAVDISYSMDPDELALQREGYVTALTSPQVIEAIRKGLVGRIGVTYLEWAGTFSQHVIADWAVIEDEKSARAFADTIAAAPVRRARRTSISGAIDFSMRRLQEAPLRPLRRVIDISGDGPNNEGGLVTLARDKALRRGVVINGLPIIIKRSFSSLYDVDTLDEYYEDCVIGGPGAFMVVINEREQFATAIRSKILREVAQFTQSDAGSVGSRGRSDCTIGEKMWRRNWDGGN